MRILFFDLATITGYALGSPAAVEESGTITFPRTGDDFGSLLWNMVETFGDLADRVKPDQIGYEAPIMPRKTNLQTLRKLYLMGPCVEAVAVKRKLPCFEGNRPDILTHFLGRGYPMGSDRQKIYCANKCRARGWKFQDYNESDALAGLDWALAVESPTFAIAGSPLFQKRA